jgi:hypothetical protein
MGLTSIVLLSAALSVAQGPAVPAPAPGPAPVLATPPPTVAHSADPPASMLQALGAGGFGLLIGWYIYYVNRYRRDDVQIGDLTTLIGIVGGGAVLGLFPPRSDLFGAYGIGLALGFFGYFLMLVILVAKSPDFGAEWFLDGRRKVPEPGYSIPGGTAVTTHPMAPRPAFAPEYSHINIQPGSTVTIQGTEGDTNRTKDDPKGSEQ